MVPAGAKSEPPCIGGAGVVSRLGCRLAVAAVAPAASCAPGLANAHAAASLVLITLDTTRADHLGAWGGRTRARRTSTPSPPAAPVSPAATRRRRSPCRATPRSSPASSRRAHGVRDNGTFVLAPKLETARRAPAPPAATTPPRWSRPWSWRAATAWTRGSASTTTTSAPATPRAPRSASGRPRTPPPPPCAAAAKLKAALLPLGALLRSARGVPAAHPLRRRAPRGPHRLYDGEIAYMDEQIGALLAEAAEGRRRGRRWGTTARCWASTARRPTACCSTAPPGGCRSSSPAPACPPARSRTAWCAPPTWRPPCWRWPACRPPGLDGRSLLPLPAALRPHELQRELPALLRLQVVPAALAVRRPLPLPQGAEEQPLPPPCRSRREAGPGAARSRGRRAAWEKADRAPAPRRRGRARRRGARRERALTRSSAGPTREPGLHRRRPGAGARGTCPTRGAMADVAQRPPPRRRAVQQGQCDRGAAAAPGDRQAGPPQLPGPEPRRLLPAAGRPHRVGPRRLPAGEQGERPQRRAGRRRRGGCLLDLGRRRRPRGSTAAPWLPRSQPGRGGEQPGAAAARAGRGPQGGARGARRRPGAGGREPAGLPGAGLARRGPAASRSALRDFREAARRSAGRPGAAGGTRRAPPTSSAATASRAALRAAPAPPPNRRDLWKTAGAIYLYELKDRARPCAASAAPCCWSPTPPSAPSWRASR